MEAYPPDYVELNLPLVLLSGLGENPDGTPSTSLKSRQESGTRIVTSSAECTGDRATQLLSHLRKHDGATLPWNSTAMPGPNGALKYHMKAIGRTFNLPPRKAAPLPQSPSVENAQAGPRSTELHSPLSPQSPGSPIYPDGVFTPQWIAKHQQNVPALLIAFFNITADDSTSQNEQIQIDINAIRTALGRSGYKSRFAVVLMSDRSILHSPELEDRLSAIRRTTTLDPKTGLFFMPPMSSQVEIATFVASVLTPLQPAVVEYYRDLTKHARRKRLRGAPVTSGAAPTVQGTHSLSTPGWNARYEVKQGIFAEFRQEMDVSERHYSAAIEELCGAEGILEASPSWSPRWREARLLCDSLAFRILRCQLWSGLTTGAVISWINYRDRMRSLIDRRRNGTQTYSFDAWECRWAEIMAQLIQHAALPVFQAPAQASDDAHEPLRTTLYAPLEKGTHPAERVPPFHLLHHSGYWLRMAFCSARARRAKALAIPEEDRIPPGQSPASAVASRSKNYDTYLVPEPHEEYPSGSEGSYDHVADLQRLASGAIREFELRGQLRSAERLRFDLAQQLADAGHFAQALETGLLLWQDCTWRDEDWHHLFGPLLSLAHRCASHIGNAGVFLATAWELLRIGDLPPSMRGLELADYFDRNQDSSDKSTVNITNAERLSPVSITCTFVDKDTHVGELVELQLVISSQAVDGSAPITLSRVEVVLSNSRTITINNQPSTSSTTDAETLLDLSGVPADDDGSLGLVADLNLRPAQKRICSFYMTFREAGAVRIQEAAVIIDNGTFILQHTFTDEDLMRAKSAYISDGNILKQRLLPHLDTTAVTVLPKPPKMQLSLGGMFQSSYVDEQIHLTVELANQEVEAVSATAVLRVVSEADEAIFANWDSKEAKGDELNIGELGASATHQAGLTVLAPSMPCSYTLVIEIKYFLESEPTTPLVKTLVAEVEVIMPFEAKHQFGPSLQPGSWPSYFDTNGIGNAEAAEGIPQRWRVDSELSSATAEGVVIHAMELAVESVEDEATCNLLATPPQTQTTLTAGTPKHMDFEFVTRKLSLDDRRPTEVELLLNVTWSRQPDSAKVATSLPVPQLTLPSSEPRVLCTREDKASEEGRVVLHYHLENPSTHFLTFALTMEANDAFAFAGPKYRTLSLAPLSRLCIEYVLCLLDESEDDDTHTGPSEGRWIWPILQVVDSYYQKNLRVHAGGPHVKIDEKRGLGVFIDGVQ